MYSAGGACGVSCMAALLLARAGSLSLLLVAGAASLVAPAAPAPLPPRQSAVQAGVVASAAGKAEAASAAATPALLALLAPGGKVWTLLGDCCPTLASLSAAELASTLRAEAAAAELTHNFAHYNSPKRWENDVDLLTLNNASYFYNLNELGYLHLANGKGAGIPAGAETQLMGFPPFTGNGGQPADFDEASQRPVYGLLNLLAIDGAMPFFGDVGFVFRNSQVRNASLFFPTDTGNWAQYNNSARAAGHCGFPYSLDLESWPSRVPGVMGHIDHILLAHEQSFSGPNRCPEAAFASPLALILRRLFGREGTAATLLSTDATFLFIEVDIAASLRFPDAVKHVVASWALVGSSWGEKLRALCIKHGWPLLWALGANQPPGVSPGCLLFMPMLPPTRRPLISPNIDEIP